MSKSDLPRVAFYEAWSEAKVTFLNIRPTPVESLKPKA